MNRTTRIAGLLMLPLVGVGLTLYWLGSSLLVAEQAQQADRDQLSAAAQREALIELRLLKAERNAIFEMVREYRRWESEEASWRLVDAIHREATRAELDPLFVTSIVAQESSFVTDAVSHAGAVGLMQLRPFVARDVATRTTVDWSGTPTLHQPDANVRLGVQYFKELLDRFEGDTALALAAYNLGPTRLSRRLHRGAFDGSDYASSVLAFYDELTERRDASFKPS